MVCTYTAVGFWGEAMLDQHALQQFSDDLCRLAAEVKSSTIDSAYALSIPFADVLAGFPDASMTQLQHWVAGAQKESQYIYQFSVDDASSADGLLQAFKKAKAQKKNGRAYARSHRASTVLYVGSSGSLMARLRQHLGYGPKGTYSMQLCHWLPSTHGSLNIKIWRFPAGMNRTVIQAIEDGYWSQQQPMFGRQGAR